MLAICLCLCLVWARQWPDIQLWKKFVSLVDTAAFPGKHYLLRALASIFFLCSLPLYLQPSLIAHESQSRDSMLGYTAIWFLWKYNNALSTHISPYFFKTECSMLKKQATRTNRNISKCFHAQYQKTLNTWCHCRKRNCHVHEISLYPSF